MALAPLHISIVMTVFNVVTYIEEAIDSVLAQEFKNFELLIVADGPSLEAWGYLESLVKLKADARIHLFKIDHVGRARALNYGLSQARADWIAILDADDLWHPLKLELQWRAVTVAPYPISFLAAKAVLFCKQKEIKDLLENRHFTSKVLAINSEALFFRNSVISHSSVLYKKAKRCYNNHLSSQIDYDLWMRLIENKDTLYLLDDVLTFHRIHSQQSFESKKILKYRFNFFKIRIKYAMQLGRWWYVPIIFCYFILGIFVNKRLKKILTFKGRN